MMITLMCLNFGTLKIINFPFGTNGKLIVLGVPILTHIMVVTLLQNSIEYFYVYGKGPGPVYNMPQYYRKNS